jgi:hypothetical protein
VHLTWRHHACAQNLRAFALTHARRVSRFSRSSP